MGLEINRGKCYFCPFLTMKIPHIPYLLPALAFFIGFVTTKSLGGGLMFGFLAFFFYTINRIQNAQKNGSSKGSQLYGNEEYTHILILLSAEVIKADQRIYPRELDLVRKRLEHEFEPSVVEKYMADLRLCLKKKVKVETLCREIRVRLLPAEKIQLLHFLTGLTVTNGQMIDYEYDLLRKIALLIDISEIRFRSILAMFRFERIRTYSKQQQSSNKSYRSTTSLSSAYAILEIDSSASDTEVKKAFRTLAKLHHPDRVVHLGPEFQKSAKIKFQKISDAYESIKTNRGFK